MSTCSEDGMISIPTSFQSIVNHMQQLLLLFCVPALLGWQVGYHLNLFCLFVVSIGITTNN